MHMGEVGHDIIALSDTLPGYTAGKAVALSNNTLEPTLKDFVDSCCCHVKEAEITCCVRCGNLCRVNGA